MRRLLSLCSFIILLTPSTLSAQGSLFSKYVDRNPREMFAQEPDVTRRLRALLGSNYSTFMKNMGTQTPLTRHNGILYSTGCLPHMCSSEDAVLFLDLLTGAIHCALHTQRDPDHYLKFSEDPQHYPEAELKEAMDQ